MANYIVTGPFNVVGQAPGSTVTDEDLAGTNLDWLIESGHIESADGASAPSAPIAEAAPAAEVAPTTAAEATTTQEG